MVHLPALSSSMQLMLYCSWQLAQTLRAAPSFQQALEQNPSEARPSRAIFWLLQQECCCC
jgi:hypothetical protein